MHQTNSALSDVRADERPMISVVVPVYKEERSIVPFLRRVEPVLERIGPYEILFCMDPSSDRTEQVILDQIARNPRIGLLVFSRRFGQPNAVMAGIHKCSGETCVIIDVDLQDPPELIADLYARLCEGYDVVYAKRKSRKGETIVKKAISHLGYRVINALSEVEIPSDTGDFRIIGSRVIAELRTLKEGHGFLRGLVAFVGFRQSAFEYDRDERAHGAGNYNRYLGSIKIGLNGLIGFSNFLLTAILLFGIAVSVISFVIACYFLVAKLVLGQPFPLGVPTIIVVTLFLGGIQLISIGVLGEYIGRVYDEVKQRPHYIIDRAVNVHGAVAGSSASALDH